MPTITAAVLTDHEQLAIEELQLDDPGRNEVLVDLRATGVCHTDYHFYLGDYDLPLPAVLGHEGAGVVESVGPGVTVVEPGDRVVLSLLPVCGECEFCQVGEPYLCQSALDARFTGTLLDGTRRLRRNVGASGGGEGTAVNHFYTQSSFATKAVVPDRSVVPIPGEIAFEHACLLGCGALTGAGAVLNTARVESGDSVAIFGCGGTGASAVLAASAISAGEIVAVDVVPEKLDAVESMGATVTIDATVEDPVEGVYEHLDGGVDYAFDFVGFDDAVTDQAIRATGPGGTVVLSGGANDGATIDVSEILAEGRTVTSNVAGSARPRVDVPRFARMHQNGDLALDQLLSRTYPLEDLEEAFRALRSGEVIKSTIVFE